jgi:zinc transport system ATP-binding protein
VTARASAGAGILACRALVVGHAGKALLPPIDIELRAGEFWAVIGRNGSGKTSWLRTLLGLLPPVSGRVQTPNGGTRLSYLPQKSAFEEHYPVLVRDVVSMGTERGWSFLGRVRRERALEVKQALSEMGVSSLADRPFRQLSEGQKQRVLLARVAASGADLAILDEPTSAMDAVAEREAFTLLDALRKRHGMTVVVVSHYLGLVQRFADRALLLDRDTPAIVTGTIDEVFGHDSFRERYGDDACGLHS